MSREVRRVPLDFDAPLNKTWAPLLMPDSLSPLPCPDCRWERASYAGQHGVLDGMRSTGFTREAYAVYSTFYPHMIGGPNADALAWCDKIGQAEVDNLIAAGRLRTYVKREPTEDNPRDWEYLPLPRTAADVNAENARGSRAMGHDAVNMHVLLRFRCETLGIEVACSTCEGTMAAWRDAEHRAAHEAWKPAEIPTGEGWQLWETVSDGSPVTPVQPTAERLVDYLVELGEYSSPQRDRRYRREAAEALVAAGGTCGSAVSVGGVTYDAVRDADKIAAL